MSPLAAPSHTRRAHGIDPVRRRRLVLVLAVGAVLVRWRFEQVFGADRQPRPPLAVKRPHLCGPAWDTLWGSAQRFWKRDPDLVAQIGAQMSGSDTVVPGEH